MTDHEKLIVALISTDDWVQGGTVTLGDVVAALYELGAQYREQMQRQLVFAAVS